MMNQYQLWFIIFWVWNHIIFGIRIIFFHFLLKKLYLRRSFVVSGFGSYMNLTIDLILLINRTLDQCLESIPIKIIIPFFLHGSLVKPWCLVTKTPSIVILFLLVLCRIFLAILLSKSYIFILAQLIWDKIKKVYGNNKLLKYSPWCNNHASHHFMTFVNA